ncbi:MAG: hypothetical protein AB7P76_00390 [Candidatus Melainabacteria bacterium]
MNARSYQMGRWYDAYPQLAFAIKVLQWSPVTLQQEAVDALDALFVTTLGVDDVADNPDLRGLRWYDHTANGWRVAMLQHLPVSLKKQAAETLMRVLNQSSAA